jgi:hypothetical protein
MRGTLIKTNDGVWLAKWSDLHSFAEGTIWSHSNIHPSTQVIRYVEDNQVKEKPFEEGLEVEFEMITSGYDENNFTPFNSAKLVFPEVDEFEKEQIIKEYVINGGYLFSIDKIDRIRDGGTIILISRGSKQTPFYIHKDNFTLHRGYPTTDTNLITDKSTQVYVLDRIQKYRNGCEFDLKQVNSIIQKIKF